MHLKSLANFSFAAVLIVGCSAKRESVAPPPTDAAAKEESRIHHGANDEVIIKLDVETQKLMGLQTTVLQPAQLNKEIKAFGRALDPSPLAALVAEVETTRTAGLASAAELQRLKTLAAQNNASARALQTAEAAAARDAAQAESARLRLLANWGSAIADRQDLAAFVKSLGSLDAVLVQLNLYPDQTLRTAPAGARLVTLASETSPVEARVLGPAPSVDAQAQGQAFLFVVSPNPSRIAPGASVMGFIGIPGEAQSGAGLPREAVIHYNGATWVYVKNSETEFRRAEVALEQPLENGWFIQAGLRPDEKVVTTGAQQLLSEELKE